MRQIAGWLRNELEFWLQEAIRWRRPGARLPNESKASLFEPTSAHEVERLVAAYDLGEWQAAAGRIDFAASLFYLQMLERGLSEAGVQLPAAANALDVGCGDWFYGPALYGLLRHYGGGDRQVTLTGVEVDAYRLSAGLRARIDWAEAYVAGLPGVTYRPGDVRQVAGPFDAVFLLFPFLFGKDLRRWGLPRRYLRPAELLAHVYGLVAPGGTLVIANLSEAERTEQHRLLGAMGLRATWWGRHDSPLFVYREPRFVTVIRKHGAD